MAKNKLDLVELERAFRSARKTLPMILGQKSVRFFRANFRRQGFLDKSFKHWEPLKHKRRHPRSHKIAAGQDILIGKGHLRNAIKRQKTSFKEIQIGVKGKPYAAIQNEGGTTHPKVTPKMRGFMRRRFAVSGNPIYAAIANTKKSTLTVKIPQRQYIGNSQKLEKDMEKRINKEIAKFLKGK